VNLAGRLLVASPLLLDPNFERTVVLLLEHGDDGALGVVVNRPSPVSVEEILPVWRTAVSAPDVVFAGGPVQPDGALGLVSLVAGPAADPDEAPLGVRRLDGGLGLVDLDAPPEVVVHVVTQMRVFAGYAGWSPGQLEAEIADGSWFVVTASSRDAFHPRPQGLWREVLRRQPSSLAWVSTFPRDPSLN
jgi:putative transcriptional regulator